MVPLVIDLDGTLLRSDLAVESVFAYLGTRPARIFRLLSTAARGRAALKAEVAATAGVDASHLPYDDAVLSMIRSARGTGRAVYLMSANDERHVQRIAAHLGLFDGWFSSTESVDLRSKTKVRRLEEVFGAEGFEYVGREAAAAEGAPRIAAARPGGLRTWLKLLRVHQWSKNALVFLPLLTGHWFGLASVCRSLGAFLAFSLAASAIYIINDLVDLDADRRHRSKRNRPLAAGTVPIQRAMALVPVLLAAAIAGALAVGPAFLGVLLAYLALTVAYTFFLKRKIVVDVITLASLYTIRVIGGAAAIAAMPSEWILGFSMFIFTSLALIKRYVELAARLDAELPDPTNRNYRKSDLNVVAAVAAASGFNAVTVFALYISSDTVKHLYRHPHALWLICPLLMYWLAYALLVAHRRSMHDDPVVFAMKDRNSLLALGLIGAIMLAAM